MTRYGADAPHALFSPEQVQWYRERYAAGGVSIRALAREAGCGYTTMQKLLSREHYRENVQLTGGGIKRYPGGGTAI